MRIYHQFGNEEVQIISDSYNFVYPQDYKGAVIEVQSRMVATKEVEVDVGCGNAFGGKNQEGEEEGAANANPVEKVNDILDGFKYELSNLSKADFQNYIKAYFKLVLPKVPAAKVDDFKAGAQAFVKFVLTRFNDFVIYTPSDYSLEGPLIYELYRNAEDEAPVFYYIIEGIPSIKV